MGLFQGFQKTYYQGNDLGNYQFTSLDDIINQFMVAYVGEDKLISKIKRTDIQFHAMRALQELSFDTFKSVKTQQIDLPPSLVMPLPHDFVNYTKILSVDSAGIKHPLYPTKDTQNPFQISQEEGGQYTFNEEAEEVIDGDFAIGDFSQWIKSTSGADAYSKSTISSGKVIFSHRTKFAAWSTGGNGNGYFGFTSTLHQQLDVSDKEFVSLSASGEAVDILTANGFVADAPGILRVGLSTNPPDANCRNFTQTSGAQVRTTNYNPNIFNLSTASNESSYIEWNTDPGNNTADKELTMIDVTNHDTIYVIIVSFNEFYTGSVHSGPAGASKTETNSIDNISVVNAFTNTSLISPAANITESSTWKNYKSTTPSANTNDDYEDDIYWPMHGSRFGLDPSHSQVNGSFFIDNRLGKIHFSSNISGKTVVLDYISDSLGTDKEMQVHKFAEEAMYKWIAYGVLSARSNVQEYVVRRFKKEKFAETRKAKLRLSNIKLEEITQVLRGKSKQIKH
tara:strand:+ start:750 stop:2276 length:1527 start_codon:yes stop_codon:yes gene_type:complete